MPLRHKDRPNAGFKSEDGTARQMKRKGCKVQSMPKNNAGYDLKCDGKKIEVKSAIKTKYKGSDGYPVEGYVFSNMKNNPKSDKHILKCLSPDRKKVIKEYEIPSSDIKQRTLTITENGKYEKFKKRAFLAQPQVADASGRVIGQRTKKKKRKSKRKRKYETVGAIVGATAVGGPDAMINAGRSILGLQYREEAVNFKNMFKMTAGAVVGKSIGSGIEQATRR